MIFQMRTLLRLKTLKEKEQLRALHRKREEVAAAARAADKASERVEASRSTLRSREDLIYNNIIGRVIDLAAIDETKARVVELEKGHASLVDEFERCKHVRARLETELESSRAQHRKAVRDVDKYVHLTHELGREAEAVVASREEAEVEDRFSGRRRGNA